jgi:hypothetical protein
LTELPGDTVIATALTETPDTGTARPRRAGAGVVALWLFAVVPAGLALITAWRAPRLHVLLDYWHVLAKITDDHGNLLLGQVFTYHLDQPFVVPSLLFWADAAWFGGDNRILTLLTVALVAGIVVCLYSMLPDSLAVAKKAALAAGFSWLLFSSHAAELWLQGTNGISWIPAVFFCALAISQAHRGRMWTAVIAGILGCLSFGAALPIWFVLAAVLWLRGDNRLKATVFAVAGVAVVGTWFLTKPAGQQSLTTSAFDPDGRLAVVAAALGGLWSADLAVTAVIAGGVTLALLALLVARALTDRPTPRDAGWFGLACYALALAVMLGLGRTTSQVPGGNVGLISRYVVIAALATSALLALAVLHRPLWPVRYIVVGVVVISLATHALGGAKADIVRRGYAPLALAGVALRVDAPTVLDRLHIQRDVIPTARALHAYPFTTAFTLGCHGPELGDTIDLTTATDLPGPTTTGTTRGTITTENPTGDTLLTGWAQINGHAPDCILITDPTGTIIGGGLTALPSTATTSPAAPDGAAWQAVTGPTTAPLTVLASAGGHHYRLQK